MVIDKLSPREQLKRITLLMNIIWAVVFIGAYTWGLNISKQSTLSLAAKEAEASFNKDLVYRRWAAGHGGIYVPTAEETPPNPYLQHIPERDVTTPSGKNLTLLNPAYMTRQVYELAAKQYGVLGHITSLNPLRPENKPDQWEKSALEDFAKGIEEVSSLETIDGNPYLRYMQRLVTEKRCLKCHAHQGYQEGDIRGGISTSVPLSSYYTIYAKFKFKYTIIVFSIWCAVFLLFNFGARVLSRQLKNKEIIAEELVIQTKLLNKSQEISHLGSWHLDIKKNILTWSDENYRIFGRSKGEFEGTYEAFLGIVHPDDREMVDRTYNDAIKNKLPYECIHRIIRDDGEVRVVHEKSEDIVDEHGETIHSIGFTHDITDRVTIEDELRRSEEKFRNFLESTVSVPWELDLETNKFTLMGKQIEKMLGYPADSWQDIDTWAERLHPEDKNEAVIFCKTETKKGNNHDFSYRAIHSDGSYRWIREVVTVITKDGAPIKLVGFMQDITDQMLAKKEKERLEDQLRQSQKMEAVGTLAGGIAHDFNNILGIILGHADLASDDVPFDSRIAYDLDKIKAAGIRAKDLVRQILAFSRQSEKERIPLQLRLILKEAVKLLRSSIPTTIKIQESYDPECGVVLADPTQVHQIVMNLCTNANHAMKESGGVLKIELRTAKIGNDSSQAIPSLEPGQYVELIVSDTGLGIGPDILERVFDPYFTTKEKGKGTGMGLAIVHGIIHEYGGAVTVESELGKGTAFHVYFPVIKKGSLEMVNVVQEAPVGGTGRILLIDDEELLVEMGKEMLERLGYNVTARQSSIEALSTFQNNPEAFDVVITDQTMPGMTGSDLSRRMLQIRPDIPIILCTGFSNLIDEVSAKSIGIREFAEKPLTKRSIAKLLQKVLDVERSS